MTLEFPGKNKETIVPKWHSGSSTSIGSSHIEKGRRNEDFIIQDSGVFGVLDGVGGQNAGDVASNEAGKFIISKLKKKQFQTLPLKEREELFADVLEEANEMLLAMINQSSNEDKLRNMATTVAVVGVVEEGSKIHIVGAGVGNTRIVILSEGTVEDVVPLDDYAESRLGEEKARIFRQKVASGDSLSPEEKSIGGMNHIIMQNLGGRDGNVVSAHSFKKEVHKGEAVVIMSDGVYTVIPDDEIASIVSTCTSPTQAAEALVREAKEKGSTDDLSAVVVNF